MQLAQYDPAGKNVFRILISDEPGQELRAQPAIRANLRSFEDLHPDFTHALLDDGQLRHVIQTYFSADVLAAYESLVPYAYKADLARYCLLHTFGGIYADISMRLLCRLELPPGKGLLCFRDAYVNGGSTWSVSNGLIYAAPGRPEMKTAIDLIVEHHRTLYYGASLLHPTGPALFGRAIAIVNRGEELEVGDLRNLTGTTHPLSYGYLDGSGRLACIRMKEHGGDLALAGVKGVNMYDALWRLRTIYGEPIAFQHTDPRLHLQQGSRDETGIQVTESMSGCVVFGPYIYLAAGRYLGRYSFRAGFRTTGMTLDVVADNAIIAEAAVEGLDRDGCATIEFTLPRSCPNVQVRLNVEPGNFGWCTALDIIRR